MEKLVQFPKRSKYSSIFRANQAIHSDANKNSLEHTVQLVRIFSMPEIWWRSHTWSWPLPQDKDTEAEGISSGDVNLQTLEHHARFHVAGPPMCQETSNKTLTSSCPACLQLS